MKKYINRIILWPFFIIFSLIVYIWTIILAQIKYFKFGFKTFLK